MMCNQTIETENIATDPATNILTVDLECWARLVNRQLTGELTLCSRNTREGTEFLLSLFKEKGAKATFFVLGHFADAFPDLVKRIDSEGHEIATHGYSHTRLNQLTPDEFRREVKLSLAGLEQVIGKRIRGFRAPEFSLVSDTSWALRILSEEGLAYDSSIFPFAGQRYGISDFPRGMVRINFDQSSIVEVPLSTVRLLGKNWPVAGGGYLRLLPCGMIRRMIRRVNRDGLPFVAYCHPYEFYSGRLTVSPEAKRKRGVEAVQIELKHNMFRRSMRHKLSRLLDEFDFTSIEEVLDRAV